MWLSWYINFSRRITKSFLFPLIVKICLHAYEFEVKEDEYEEILKYEVSSVYRKWIVGGGVSFWEMWGVNGIMNVEWGVNNEVDVVKE